MKVLVLGSGGREHAISWKLAQDDRVETVFCIPGNGGTAQEEKCQNLKIDINNFDEIIDFVKNNNIELTVVGPEDPLAKGIVNRFEEENLLIFGPRKEAAMMESSKAFAKDIMMAANIPTADYKEFTDFESAKDYVTEKGAPIVVKADGLAAGKGVTVASTVEMAVDALKEIFEDKVFGKENIKVVIEEFMEGEEATYLAITDGENILPLSVSQDHKQVYDGDKGPNTGGMGAYSPAPIVDDEKMNFVTEKIARPMIAELKKRGITYKGVIYAGLMVNGDSIKVVEFNARFGDPECEVVLSKIKSGLLDVLIDAAKGNMTDSMKKLEINDVSVTCVILISGGYPKSYESGFEITGIEEANLIENIKVFHAGTKLSEENNKYSKVLTSGGRVLCVTANGQTLKESIDTAYKGVSKINFNNMAYRKDIAAKGLRK